MENITEDSLIRHMDKTKDCLFVVTHNDKPICYTLDYTQAVNVNTTNIEQYASNQIYTDSNLKVFKIKSIGY